MDLPVHHQEIIKTNFNKCIAVILYNNIIIIIQYEYSDIQDTVKIQTSIKILMKDNANLSTINTQVSFPDF